MIVKTATAAETAAQSHSPTELERLTDEDTLADAPISPGFSVLVAELFGEE